MILLLLFIFWLIFAAALHTSAVASTPFAFAHSWKKAIYYCVIAPVLVPAWVAGLLLRRANSAVVLGRVVGWFKA